MPQGVKGEGGALILTCNGQTARLPLGAEESWVQSTFNIPGDGQRVTIWLSAEGSARVTTYLVS